MSHKDEIRKLALAINEGVSAYVDVHNYIHKENATVVSFLKNLIGMGVPMSVLLERAESLLPLWSQLTRELNSCALRTSPQLLDDERLYFDALSSFVSKVDSTVGALVERQRLMSEASKSAKNNPMTWEKYREAEKAYQVARGEQAAVGQRLNSLSKTIF